MNDNILSASGETFHKFTAYLTDRLSKPKTKFISQILCGVLFSGDLILTNVASKVPHPGRLAAIAKRFRRHLADGVSFLRPLWFNYLTLASRRLDVDSLFIVDLSDIAKPYAKKMENLALVRDGDKGCLVAGYWCMEVYCRDKDGIIWPLMLWPYCLEAEGQLSENAQILQILSQLDEYFGGRRKEFSLKLDLRGTEFQKRVWRELQKIPFGKSVSYLDVALAVGTRESVRAVGRANGQNPIVIVVPCHRVIGSDGSLTGYGGGLWRKRWLLDFEGGTPQPSLFVHAAEPNAIRG